MSRIRLSQDLDAFDERGVLVLKDKSVLDDEDGEDTVEMESFDFTGKNSSESNVIDLGITILDRKNASLNETEGPNFIPSEFAQGSFEYKPLGGEVVPSGLKFQSDFLASSFKPVSVSKKKKRKINTEEESIVLEPAAVLPEDADLHTQLGRLRMDRRNLGEDFIDKQFIRAEAVDTSADVESFLARLDGKSGNEAMSIESLNNETHDETMSIPDEPLNDQTRDKTMSIDDGSSQLPMTDVKLDLGLASALAFFQSRNVKSEPSSDAVHIDRRDEFGRSIADDPKLAYKQLSWKFHGVKPGAKKTDKRIRKIEKEMKSNVL